MNKESIISNTSEPLKTYFQLNVAKLGIFDGLHVATEDLQARRHTRRGSDGSLRFVQEKMKGEMHLRQGQEHVARKAKKVPQANGYGEAAAAKTSYFEGECRHCGKYEHKAVTSIRSLVGVVVVTIGLSGLQTGGGFGCGPEHLVCPACLRTECYPVCFVRLLYFSLCPSLLSASLAGAGFQTSRAHLWRRFLNACGLVAGDG